MIREIRQTALEGVTGLHREAIEALRKQMTSGTGATVLKAAVYVLEKIESREPGVMNARAIIRQNCTKYVPAFIDPFGGGDQFDEEAYTERCKELGLTP